MVSLPVTLPRNIERHVLDFKIEMRLGSEDLLDAVIRGFGSQGYLQW
jgi:hypothetical protein